MAEWGRAPGAASPGTDTSTLAPRVHPAATRDPTGWKAPARFALRFSCVYLVLSIFPFPLGALPFTGRLAEACQRPWDLLVPWVARNLLRLQREVAPLSGSDTTYAAVQVLCIAAIAAAAALAWTLRDPRGLHLAGAHRALRVYVRYYLAVSVIGYGMAKVIPQQFPFPPLERMLVPFGEASPRGLLWTFMGYSRLYTGAAGVAEVAGALLLCFRRTTALGALLLLGLLSNVVMVNLCYDVQVKLYSFHLLLMAAFLFAPEVPALVALWARRAPESAGRLAPPARLLLKGLFIGTVLASAAMQARSFSDRRGAHRAPPLLRGIYRVEQFERNGVAIPPLATDASRWESLIADVADGSSDVLIVRSMTGQTRRYPLESGAATIGLRSADGQRHLLDWSRPDPDHLLLQGSFQGERLSVRLRQLGEAQLPLLHRGITWIHDPPPR